MALSFRSSILMGSNAPHSTSLRSVFPDSVLLCKSARISERRNETTAVCETSEGQAVEVSFWLVDAPDVSYFSVNCPGLKERDFSDEPMLICAEAAFVLFSVTLRRTTHYFVYRAAPAGKQSLQLLPVPKVAAFRGQQFGFLPRGDTDGEHYAVAFLDRKWTADDDTWRFDAYIFSVETQEWRSSKASTQYLSESDKLLWGRHASCKQIAVGESSLGWVDLVRGILLLCNLFNEEPLIKFIPFPASSVGFADKDGLPYYAAEYFYDVICCGDLIKFAQIEYDDPSCRSSGKGWKVTIWNMKISWNSWQKSSTADVSEFSVDRSNRALFSELWETLSLCCVLLSLHKDNCIYMMAKLNDTDNNAWVITIDIKKASLEATALFSIERYHLITMYRPCVFSMYFNMTPGVDMDNLGDRWGVESRVVKLLSLEWFRTFDQCLEVDWPTYNECSSLLQNCPVSSLRSNIQSIAKYASDGGQREAASQAVEFLLRALEHFESAIHKLASDQSISIEVTRSKTSDVLQALDNILELVTPTWTPKERTPGDACHQRRGKAVVETCDSTRHADDKSDKCQQGKFNLNSPQGKKDQQYNRRDCEGRAVVSARWLLYYVCCILISIFVCLYLYSMLYSTL